MLAPWDEVEADFAREYRIDLASEVWAMSWRRFRALINGLSGASSWATIVHGRPGSRRRSVGRTVKGADTDAYFASFRRTERGRSPRVAG